MTVPPQPTPGGCRDKRSVKRPEKSRLLQDGRDMFWSMAPLVLACIVLAGVLGMCSFAPNGPGPGPAPHYDAPAALQADADALKFPDPAAASCPTGGRPTRVRRGSIDGRTDRRAGNRPGR